jgi:hypothetical protein
MKIGIKSSVEVTIAINATSRVTCFPCVEALKTYFDWTTNQMVVEGRYYYKKDMVETEVLRFVEPFTFDDINALHTALSLPNNGSAYCDRRGLDTLAGLKHTVTNQISNNDGLVIISGTINSQDWETLI